MRALLLFIVAALLATPAIADGTGITQIAEETGAASDGQAASMGQPAPFGLTWGMSKEEIEALGVALRPQEDQSRGAEYVATKLPKMVEGAKGVLLDLGFGGKLYSITVISEDYDNDRYGTQIISRYDELVAVLTQKYGAGKSNDYTSPDYKHDRWAYGLWKNENSKYTTFETETLEIEISCRSQDMSDPYWVIIYSHKEGASLEQEAKKRHEKEAL